MPMSKRDANGIRRRQDDLVNNYIYTTQDIEKNLKERKKKGSGAANLGSELMRAVIGEQAAEAALEEAKRRLEEAQKNGADKKDIAEARIAVETFEEALLERKKEAKMINERMKTQKHKLTQRSKDKKWAKVNQRSIMMNQQADFDAYKTVKEEETTADGKPKFNPYARRKVKPKILWEVGQQDEKEGEEKAAEAKKDAEKRKEAAAAAEEAATPTLVQEQQEKAAVLSQSHQFAIDEEVLAQSSYTKGISGLTGNKKVRARVRQGLSLADYQVQKAGGTL
jgi:RNA polymerase-associated protein RTF1